MLFVYFVNEIIHIKFSNYLSTFALSSLFLTAGPAIKDKIILIISIAINGITHTANA